MRQHIFERVLSVSTEEIEFSFEGFRNVEWAHFFLNPRRLRGSDFLMRWSQGVWSERRFTEAINATSRFYTIPYGPSGVAPKENVREFELYFERLEKAGLGAIKRPDLLVFDADNKNRVSALVDDVGGEAELPFIPESELSQLLDLAILGIECENSLWVAGKMPDYNATLRPMRRLGGKLGLPKNAILPTVILKEEDRGPILEWQKSHNLPIHIWHAFYDKAYGLALDGAMRLIDEGLIEATAQVFQAPGGATTEKKLYKFYHHYAYEIGVSAEPPTLVPDFIEDPNGHILPYVRFEGGRLNMGNRVLEILEGMKK